MTEQPQDGWFKTVKEMTQGQAVPYLMKLLNLDPYEATRLYKETLALPYDELIEIEPPPGYKSTGTELKPDQAYLDPETGALLYRDPE